MSFEMDNSRGQSVRRTMICCSRRCRVCLSVIVIVAAIAALVVGILGFTDNIDLTGNKAVTPIPPVIDDAPGTFGKMMLYTVDLYPNFVLSCCCRRRCADFSSNWFTKSSPHSPTTSPVGMADDPLLLILKSFSLNGLDDTASPQYQAYQWLLNEDPLTDANTEPARLAQRYSLATMYASLSGDIPAYATRNECEWPTVECGSPSTNATNTNDTNVFRPEPWQVTEINMARQSFTGTIPPEISLLRAFSSST